VDRIFCSNFNFRLDSNFSLGGNYLYIGFCLYHDKKFASEIVEVETRNVVHFIIISWLENLDSGCVHGLSLDRL
jgi:hypothetical protein